MMHRRTLTIAFAMFLLAACHGRAPGGTGDPQASDPDAQKAALPRPQAGDGSVTGMPDGRAQPLPGDAATIEAPPAMPVDAGLPPTGATAPVADITAGAQPATPGTAADSHPQGTVIGDSAEPGVDDAVTVVRDYYDAINRGAYERAYALWSGRGSASGKSLQQFSDGFAETGRDSIDIKRPGRVDAAAGNRFVEIPVKVTAINRDQSRSTYSGIYVLRRSVVDGATPEQRKWRIQSANMHQED